MSMTRTAPPDNVCHYCGIRLTPATRTRDHIIPVSVGGSNKPFNIVPACKTCNYAKGSLWSECECDHCANAKIRYATTEQPPEEEGRRCPDCDEITITPFNCPWCYNGQPVRQEPWGIRLADVPR